MDYSMLVNKDNPLNKYFVIENLVPVGKHYDEDNNTYIDCDILLESVAANYLSLMLEEVNKIDDSKKVIPNSGYRDIVSQQRVMDYYIELEGIDKAMKRVSIPGTSEHHTGLAIDIAVLVDGKELINLDEAKEQFEFIIENAYKYGFILRYPSDKTEITGIMYEPWHFRYVGERLAKYLYFNNLTLEEYYSNIKINSSTSLARKRKKNK